MEELVQLVIALCFITALFHNFLSVEIWKGEEINCFESIGLVSGLLKAAGGIVFCPILSHFKHCVCVCVCVCVCNKPVSLSSLAGKYTHHCCQFILNHEQYCCVIPL